jgi:hypothetical protein
MKPILFICLFLLNGYVYAQSKCVDAFVHDTCTLENPLKLEPVESINVTIKNNYLIQFIKQHKKQYLKITVKDNLGFGRTGSLKLILNKKQIYLKTIKLEIIDKTSAYFIIELNLNYLMSIEQNGLTSIIFIDTNEFSIPRQDSEQIKKAAKCFIENTTKH